MSILLNDNELRSMLGLPHALIALYLYIRKCMDMGTGMVGIRTYISHQALLEALYVEPEQGRVKSGSPSKMAVRRMCEALERYGLVKICSNSSNRQLIFKCLLATHDKSAQNKPDIEPDISTRPSKPTTARVLELKKQKPDIEPDTHPSLYIYSVDNSSSSYRGSQGIEHTDDDEFETEAKPKTQPPHVDLIFPARLEDWQKAKMRSAMNGLPPEDAQAILDELAGRMRSGKVEKPLGYFQRVMENYLRGDFNGELAAGEKAIRERAEREKVERQAEEARRMEFKANPDRIIDLRQLRAALKGSNS